MRTDTILRCDGMRILAEHLGIVNPELEGRIEKHGTVFYEKQHSI